MLPRWLPAYIGLGSNLDDPPARLRRAISDLGGLESSALVSVSPMYRSAPMGPADQPEYVNAVAGILTRLTPEALLAALQGLEAAQGRRRDGPRWGPRTLDLDLLAMGALTRGSPDLTLPHPGVGMRPFVLVPLADIAPGLRLPGVGRIAELAGRAARGGLMRLEQE